MPPQQPGFRVLIAGGSVVGLTLANALEKAGIDFLVLETGDIAPALGAFITLLPSAAHTFEQLGAWEDIRSHGRPLDEKEHFDENGRRFMVSYELRALTQEFHQPFVAVERQFVVRVLYQNLQDRSSVRERTGVVSFMEDEEGVTIMASTGEEIRGSVLVGADGVHSGVRRQMAEHLDHSNPKMARNLREGRTSQGKPECITPFKYLLTPTTTGFVATYRVITGISSNLRGDGTQLVPDGKLHCSYNQGFSGLCATSV